MPWDRRSQLAFESSRCIQIKNALEINRVGCFDVKIDRYEFKGCVTMTVLERYSVIGGVHYISNKKWESNRKSKYEPLRNMDGNADLIECGTFKVQPDKCICTPWTALFEYVRVDYCNTFTRFWSDTIHINSLWALHGTLHVTLRELRSNDWIHPSSDRHPIHVIHLIVYDQKPDEQCKVGWMMGYEQLWNTDANEIQMECTLMCRSISW